MPQHTVVNLKDVENSAERLGFEARFPTGALGLEKSGISYQRLSADQRLPFGHRQKEQEEVYVVLSGAGRINVDGEISEVRALDAIRVAPTAARAFEAGPEGIELLAFGAPRTGDSPGSDAEVLPGWWGD